ncbi:MAG: hypothetical protein FOGNACKC_02725 [Anaerolineae bacterium]|nr:hypothetical protein [Anaerolineae bacterium]
MKRKLMILTPILLLLAGGFLLLLLAGGALWLLTGSPAHSSQPIRIALAPNLPSFSDPLPAGSRAPGSSPAGPGAAPLAANSAFAPASAPGGVIPATPDTAQTRLVIPRLNLDTPIIPAPIVGQSWQVDHLRQEVGHLAGTAAPGAASNVVLAGHVSLVDGSAGPFARLNQLAPGDEVWLADGGSRYRYIIDNQQVVAPEDIQVTYPSTAGQITLITCSNWQNDHYANRLVVTGHLVEN